MPPPVIERDVYRFTTDWATPLFVPLPSPCHKHSGSKMMYSRLTLAATVAALFATAVADLLVIAPGGPDLWWGELHKDSSHEYMWTDS